MSAAPQLHESTTTEYATKRAKRSTREHLKVVAPLRPDRASRGVFAIIVTGLLALGLIGMLVINTSLAQGAFVVTELQRDLQVAVEKEQALAEEIAALAGPVALEQSARSLGMVPNASPAFVDVDAGRILGRPKATAGNAQTKVPKLATPADATAAEAVDNASVGADLPVAPGENYDPATADAKGKKKNNGGWEEPVIVDSASQASDASKEPAAMEATVVE
jgi:hypothetical protein